MLRDFDVCFLPLITAVSLKVTQENSQSCLFTHHTCDCACFFQLICGTMSYTAATINEALWLHASLCLRRRVPLASGQYLDAGWRWPSGDPFTCSTAWSPGFPTHHTSRGWHYWGYSILSQAGMHGEISFFLLLFYKHLHIDANLWVIVKYVYVIKYVPVLV